MTTKARRAIGHDVEPPMPHNLQAERSVLGAVLLDEAALIPAMQRLAPEDFFLSQHLHIFGHMIDLRQKNVAIDTVTLMEQLQSAGDLEASGGAAYLSTLADGLPRATNVDHYAAIVKNASARRRLIYAAQDAQEQVFAGREISDIVGSLRKRLSETELAGPSTALQSYTPAELAALVSGPIEHVAYPIALRGMLSVLDGAAKASGKTTLVLHAIRAVLRGEMFLNRPTKRVNVLLVSEENKRTLSLALGRVDLSSETSGLHTLPRESWAGIGWPVLAERLERKCTELNIGWLITDTFFAVCALAGDQENEAGTVDQAIAPLRNIAGKLDIPVTLTRHERKSGGEIGQSGRGSSALTGACDVILQLRRMSTNYRPEMRQLEITGRIDPDKLTIELSLGRYISHEHADARSSTGEELEILTATIQADPTRSIRELANLTGINKNRVTKLAARTGWQKPKGKGKPWTQSKT